MIYAKLKSQDKVFRVKTEMSFKINNLRHSVLTLFLNTFLRYHLLFFYVLCDTWCSNVFGKPETLSDPELTNLK